MRSLWKLFKWFVVLTFLLGLMDMIYIGHFVWQVAQTILHS